MKQTNSQIDDLCLRNIRILSQEMISNASSGHSGISLGCACILHTLYTRFLNVSSEYPDWINRDRFILSCGHASALLYILNLLSGFDISVSDLKEFRLGNKICQGHPEYNIKYGIEFSSGLLGEGLATALGIAIAQKNLEAQINKYDFSIIDYYTYVLCSDGDLQEGVSYETLSLLGHLKLEKMIILYDSNNSQIDSFVSDVQSIDNKSYFESIGLHYVLVDDGQNVSLIEDAINLCKEQNLPSIIEIKTRIGTYLDEEGSNSCHSLVLDNYQLEEFKKKLDFNNEPFYIDNEVLDYYKETIQKRSYLKINEWSRILENYRLKYKSNYELLDKYISGFTYDIPKQHEIPEGPVLLRKILKEYLYEYSNLNDCLIGGSADLSKSTCVKGNDGNFSKENYLGRNILFGVKEHAMSAIINGLTLSKMRGFCSTYLSFLDYMLPSIRMACIMKIPSIFIFTHDSINVGKDGSTHIPVEQLGYLKEMIGLNFFRPSCEIELYESLKYIINETNVPSVLVLPRENSYNFLKKVDDFSKGAYIIYNREKKDISYILVSSGNDLYNVYEIAKELEEKNIFVRVVSMVSFSLFDKQSDDYKEKILPKNIKKIAIESSKSYSYYKYCNKVIGINEFGMSMSEDEIRKYFKFTKDDIIKKILEN